MSQARSSKAGAGAALGAIAASVAAFALAACAHGATTAVESARPVTDSRVGYVRMDLLVKKHPLYTQLARLDEDLQALQLTSVGVEIARSGADIAIEEKRLQGELDGAAARTKAALADKQQQYAKRERAAIDAALGGAAGASGPGGAEIAGGIARRARAQQQSVLRDAQKNLQTYRSAVIAQDRSAVDSLNTSLGERASRSYRARADELQKKEADYALSLASDDSAERLSLHTKLSNLALDDASREDVKKQLDALDKKESDALGAMKNRDQETLAVLQRDLHARVRVDLNGQVAQLRKRTLAKINARETSTRQQIDEQLAPLGVRPPGAGQRGASGGPAIAPDMRAKLEALHKKYQNDFDKDASLTIAAFAKTRHDLTRRFAELGRVDRSAQGEANKQMGALQKQRGDLYGAMVAQIGREVKVIAEKRGINVVVSGVVAPAGGVDLTADTEKDIESLHE